MKKLFAAVFVSAMALASVFAEWDKITSVGMSFPNFNAHQLDNDTEYEDENGCTHHGDDYEAFNEKTGIDFSIQQRFVHDHLAFLVSYDIGGVSLDASDFFGEGFSGSITGLNQFILGGVGVRFVNAERLNLILSGVMGVGITNCSTSVDLGIKDLDTKFEYTAVEFNMGGDIYGQLNLTDHIAISASLTILLAPASKITEKVTTKYDGKTSESKSNWEYNWHFCANTVIPKIFFTFRF
jgi:hypothetical protein